MTADAAKKPRRLPRFSLRSLILFGVLAAPVFPIGCGSRAKLGALTPEQAAKSLFGDRVSQVVSRDMSERVRAACPQVRFYTVTIPFEKPVPAGWGDDTYHAMAIGGRAYMMRNGSDVALLLNDLRQPINNANDAMNKCLVLADLLGGTLRTDMPMKESLFDKYKKQKREDWVVESDLSPSGWIISLTLMTDSGIEHCERFTLRLSKEGAVSLLEQRTVYAYTGYE